jgi:hypothetical protein
MNETILFWIFLTGFIILLMDRIFIIAKERAKNREYVRRMRHSIRKIIESLG